MTAPPPPAPPVEPPAWAPPPPPPTPPARTQLRRSSTDKMVGGVCGGLADYSGIDPLLWRVGFVALAIAGGSGVLVYLLLWLLMPSAPSGPYDSAAPTRRPARVRPPAGPRSPVPGITLAGLLIVLGVLAFLARVAGWNAQPRDFFGAGLLVVGLGLIAAAFSGGRRARSGLVALGIVLSLGLVGSSTSLHWHGGTGVGDRTYTPLTAADVQSTYNGGVGDMNVDLTGVDLGNATVPIRTRIQHGVGDVTVEVPESADVRVTVDNGLGTVNLFDGEAAHGGVYMGSGSEPWTADGKPEFVITIGTGVGDVEVSRG